MNPTTKTLEQVHAELIQVRLDPSKRKKFPEELWNSIVQLTERHSEKDICAHLAISRALLSKKIARKNHSKLEFREIHLQDHFSSPVTIELSSPMGVSAKIQGPPSCLQLLLTLFKR